MSANIFEVADYTIHQLILNELKTNCFIIQFGNEGVLIDPTANAEFIIEYVKIKKISLQFLIATHGHFDHISAANEIIQAGLVKTLYVHHKDFLEVKKARTYMMMVLKKRMKTPTISAISNRVIEYLNCWGLLVRHVGGHTKGSCVFFNSKFDFLISGDLILQNIVNLEKVSQRENLEEFAEFYKWVETNFYDKSLILPGHGKISSLNNQLASNRKWQLIRDIND